MQHVAAEDCNKLQSPLLGCTGSSTEASSFAEETSSAASSSAEGASQRKGCWQRVCCTCGASSSSNSTSSAVSRNTSTLRRRRRGVGMLCCLSQQQQQQQQQPSRMLDRNAPFQQCRGEYNITHTHAHLHGYTRARLYFNDWFHSLLYSPTYRVFFLLFLSYTTTVICFGFLYYTVSNVGSRYNLIAWLSGEQNHDGFCNMDINNIMEAIYFSLSTMTTIGYGVSDYYFGDCWAPFLLVLLQVFCAITFDAIAIGVIFMRISRGRKRSRTVVFSSTALLRRVRGDLYVFWRVGDLVKRHQLVDCSVKVYCVKHERELLHGSYEAQVGTTTGNGNGSTVDNSTGNNAGEAPPAYEDASTPPPPTTSNNHLVETAYYQTYPMSMHRPQTDTDVLLALPSFVVHKIDASSPLMPPKRWVDEGGRVHVWDGWTLEGGGVQEGQEQEQQQQQEGQGQGQGQQQEMAPQPTQSTTTNTTIPPTTNNNTTTLYQIQQDQITTYLTDRQAEIIVLVEGIDEMTSSIVQARHSYHALDLCWNATFQNCVFSKREYERRRRLALALELEREVGGWWCRWRRRWKGVGGSGFGSGNGNGNGDGNISENVYGGGCVVDFSKFHEFIEAPVDCDACPYIS